MFKQSPPAPTASAVGPCPTVIQIVGRPGTGSLPSTIAPPDPPISSGCPTERGVGRVVRCCWVNFQCWGVLLIWMIVEQGSIVLAVGADGGWFGHFFSRLSYLSSFSLSLGDGPI